MHRLTITSNLLDRPWPAMLALPVGVTAHVLGPWGTLATAAVLVASRAVTITWPATAQEPTAEEVSR